MFHLVLLCFGIREQDGMHEKLSEPMHGRKTFIVLELIKRVIKDLEIVLSPMTLLTA
jgi:hypothetical protein